jgi:molecular chaperone DnaJ
LYVDVRVQEDERFLREGDDLITVLDLTMTEASLGVVAMIPTVDGEDHELEIPAGTQPGTRMTLSRLGAGRLHSQQRSRSGELDRGDLIVFCNVRVPTNLSSEQRDVLERFHSVETDQNYDEREGILTKLRRMVRP